MRLGDRFREDDGDRGGHDGREDRRKDHAYC